MDPSDMTCRAHVLCFSAAKCSLSTRPTEAAGVGVWQRSPRGESSGSGAASLCSWQRAFARASWRCRLRSCLVLGRRFSSSARLAFSSDMACACLSASASFLIMHLRCHAPDTQAMLCVRCIGRGDAAMEFQATSLGYVTEVIKEGEYLVTSAASRLASVRCSWASAAFRLSAAICAAPGAVPVTGP